MNVSCHVYYYYYYYYIEGQQIFGATVKNLFATATCIPGSLQT